MDGKGRWIDNVMIERFFRSLKYEEIYINPCDTVTELKSRINNYINFYNTQRLHQSLDYNTPSDIYHERVILDNELSPTQRVEVSRQLKLG